MQNRIFFSPFHRTEGSSTNDDVVYLVKTLEVLKGEVEENYVDGTMKLSLTTGGNSALCGIFMEIGEEYLIDLFHDDFSEDELTVVGSCGLFSSVDTSDSEQNNLLAGGCDDHDPCGGTCDDFQVLAHLVLTLNSIVGDSTWQPTTLNPPRSHLTPVLGLLRGYIEDIALA